LGVAHQFGELRRSLSDVRKRAAVTERNGINIILNPVYF
jgi:hypothetical protein